MDTPTLDALAAVGVELDQYYVQPVCSPTRGREGCVSLCMKPIVQPCVVNQ